jgi:hypothetical protein
MHPAVAQPKKGNNRGFGGVKARKAVERGVPLVEPVHELRPDVSGQGLGEQLPPPPVHRDGEDRVDRHGYESHEKQRQTERRSPPIVDEGEVKHGEKGPGVVEKEIEEGHLGYEGYAVVKPAEHTVQAETLTFGIEASRPPVEEDLREHKEEPEHEQGVHDPKGRPLAPGGGGSPEDGSLQNTYDTRLHSRKIVPGYG